MDTAILYFIQEHFHNGFTDFIFPFFTSLGELGLIWIGIALLLCITKQYRRCGIQIFIALTVTFLLGEVLLKNIVQRPRPFVGHPGIKLLIPPPNSFSFPSGHSASSFCASMMLWLHNRHFGTAALFLAACIAFSRIFLFVHYPSDVLAGAFLGTICSLFLYHFFNGKKCNHFLHNLSVFKKANIT